MASLSYHSQHLAWQQRVRKEQTAASEFSKTFDSFRLSSSMQAPAKSLRSAFPARKSIRTSLRTTPVPKHNSQSPVKPHPPPEDDFEAELRRRAKEVRGKYSRPVITVNGTLQLQDTGFTSLTKRPVTSGSLVSSRRGRDPTPDRKKTASVGETTTPRSHMRTKSLVYSYRRKTDDESPEKGEKVDRTVRGEKAEKPVEPPAAEKGQLEDQEEQKEEKPAEPDTVDVGVEADTEPLAGEDKTDAPDDGDARSTASWITSKSQKRYIEELEQLLRTERMKRIIAEEKLAVINFSAKS